MGQERARHGFGRDVRQALVRRQQWLIEQGLMQRDGNDVVFRKDILEVLREREVRQVGTQLEAQIGKAFVEPIPGVCVDGVCRQTVDMASGRSALIEKSLEFALVPWRPALERHIGRAVSGIPHGDGFDWTTGRGRGGPSF